MNINPKLRSVILPSGLRLLVTKEHLHASYYCCLETNEEKQCLAYGSQFAILSDLGVLGSWVARFSERLESEKQLAILTTCCSCGNGFQALSWACASLMSQRSPLCACETSDTNCARENNNFSVPLNSLPPERLQSAAQQWHIQLFSPLTVNVATSRQSAPNKTAAFITGNNVSPGSWSVVVYGVLICSHIHTQRRHTSKEGKFITKMNSVLFWKLWMTDLGAIFRSQFCHVFNIFVFGAFAAFFIRYGGECIKLLWREWGWNRDMLARFKPKLLV